MDDNIEIYKKKQLNKSSNNKSSHLSFKELIITIVFAVVFAQFLTNYIIVNAHVPSASMEPTIMTNNNLFVDRIFYKSKGINRGDIMVFYPPDLENSGSSEMYIKRVIGLPGETIEGKDGYVYIDSKKLEEPYVSSKLNDDFGPYKIPNDSYFMMGDNRTDSYDSRYWTNKYVNIDEFVGRALFRYTGGFEVYKTITY